MQPILYIDKHTGCTSGVLTHSFDSTANFIRCINYIKTLVENSQKNHPGMMLVHPVNIFHNQIIITLQEPQPTQNLSQGSHSKRFE